MMKRLGVYIRPVDVRNRDLKVTRLVGLTIDKAFIPSVANTIGTDLSNYKVISENQFACSLMQVSRDGKMPIAMFKGEPCIMSPAYPMFEVAKKNELLPEYLMMWFSRSEFDREASFYAVGGVRGSLEWNDFCDMRIPVPAIEKQREIVAEYNTLATRIETNKKLIATLEQTAQTLYRHTFVDNIDPNNLSQGWRMGTVADLVTTQYGYTEIATEEKVGPKFLRITDIVGSQIDWNSVPHCPITESEYKKYQLKEGDIVVSRTGANIGYAKQIRGEIPEAVYASFLVRLKPIDETYNWYLGLSVDSQEYKDFIFANQQGSAQPQANANIMGQYPLAIPEEEIVKKFNALIVPILRKISLHQEEINKLNEMKPLLLSKMGA